MKEKIDKTIAKTIKNIQRENTHTISVEKKTLGDPDCKKCHGAGYLRADVPVGHPQFGIVELCSCRLSEVSADVRNRLYQVSHLDELAHLTFDTFKEEGRGNFLQAQAESVEKALSICKEFAGSLSGWLLLHGVYGCGKTHLAAAIANYAVEFSVPTLFITVPDLLDNLRFAYQSPETTFEARFNEVREVNLLILDDFGTQNATAWAQEKLFQILNFRYINHLPTVITTNLQLDEIEGRIRSRLQDRDFVNYIHIQAPDYRRLHSVSSTPALSSLELLKDLTFDNFLSRENEVGNKQTISEFEERVDEKTNEIKRIKTTIVRQVSREDVENLAHVTQEAYDFANKPKGWLVILGPSGSGKTHLAASIGNLRVQSGYSAILVEAAELLDYLRSAFSPDSAISLGKRFEEIKTVPLLILDSLGTHHATPWAEEKLYQILNFRYMAKLPTVITSQLTLEEIEQNHQSLANRFLDTSFSTILVIEMPPYRRSKKASHGKRSSRKK